MNSLENHFSIGSLKQLQNASLQCVPNESGYCYIPVELFV